MRKYCRCEQYIWHAKEVTCKNGRYAFCNKCISEMKDKVGPLKVLQEKVDCLEMNQYTRRRVRNENIKFI